MEIHNFLPLFVNCLKQWDQLPNRRDFNTRYLKPLTPMLAPMLEDFSGYRGADFYDLVAELDWNEHRTNALNLDPVREEARLRSNIQKVEKLLGVTLRGEAVLFGSFRVMDGYARFHHGTHRVYLGVDEDFANGSYIDVLTTHELTHTARESLPSVWAGWGHEPSKMTHDDFVANQTVIEHLTNEGMSCLVSELLNPGLPEWAYCYQKAETLEAIRRQAGQLDDSIHRELADPRGHYRNLYDTSHFDPPLAMFAHYAWAWQWARHVLKKVGGGDPRKILGVCSKDLLAEAAKFRLAEVLK